MSSGQLGTMSRMIQQQQLPLGRSCTKFFNGIVEIGASFSGYDTVIGGASGSSDGDLSGGSNASETCFNLSTHVTIQNC